MSFSNSIVNQVLVDTGRCCAVCHKFCGFKIELHHIKQKADGGEDTYENCIPLCLDCHAEVKAYDPHHPKGRKYTEKELIMHRNKWYEKISGSLQFHSDEMYKKLDEEVFIMVKKKIFESGTINFLREHHFGEAFKLAELKPLRDIFNETDYNPELEFIDADLEKTFANLISSIKEYLVYSSMNTFSHEVMDGYQYVPSDWLKKGDESSRHYYEVVEKLNQLTTNVVNNYDVFAKLARRKFAR